MEISTVGNTVGVSLSMYERKKSFLVMYDKPASNTHLEHSFKTRAEAEAAFMDIHTLLSSKATAHWEVRR